MDPVRRAFLDDRRESSRRRYDDTHSARYDDEWGSISPTHRVMMNTLLQRTTPGGIVLDAACGTGKYWQMIVASGRSVVGVDQSVGMLEVAASKRPDVSTRVEALQDLDEHESYDAVVCIDAMENVGPEDWPVVLMNLQKAVRRGGPLYVTVERPDENLDLDYQTALQRGDPVVTGESFDGVGYHYYPTDQQVERWVAACGLTISDTKVDDWYLHLLLERPSA